MSSPEIHFGALTDVGRTREHNEDNYLVDKKLGLFVVCDGMGGHAAGEVASALAVRTIHDEIKKEADLIRDYAEGASGGAKVSKRDILNMLEFAVNRASNKVHSEAAKDAKKRGMGTTLVALLVVGNQGFIIYVGDSRIYLLRDGVLEQITEDHTVYNELIKRKKMPKEQVEQLAQKHAITRAVGVYEHVEPDTLVVDLLQGDRFLLCSDGLSGYFEDEPEQLGKFLAKPDADAVVKELIDWANEHGGKDNITSVIVTVGDASARDENRAKKLQLKREILARMPLFRPLSGQLKVTRNGADVAVLPPGAHVGEMALVRSQPRSATVTSEVASELMVIRRQEFFEILRKEHQLAVKLLWQFTGVLADRLAETTRELGAAKEELAAEDITSEIFAEEEDEDRKTLVIPPPPPSRRAE